MNNAVRRRFPALSFPLKTALVLALGLLAGCAGDAAHAPGPSPAAQTESPAAQPQTAALPAPARAPAPAPQPAPEINAPAPAEVIGWSTQSLNETFGSASLVRRDLGAEIWQYRTEQCVLLLFLYPKPGAEKGPLAVDHLDVANGLDKTDCVKSVVRAHLRRSTG
jgi:hypothetical protein